MSWLLYILGPITSFVSIVTDEDLRGRNVLHFNLFELLHDCSTIAPFLKMFRSWCCYNVTFLMIWAPIWFIELTVKCEQYLIMHRKHSNFELRLYRRLKQHNKSAWCLMKKLQLVSKPKMQCNLNCIHSSSCSFLLWFMKGRNSCKRCYIQ